MLYKVKMKFLRPYLWWILLALAATATVAYWWNGSTKTEARYRTAAVDVGDINQVITANGTLNPVTLVNVGTQVSGTVKKLHVDFNARVQPGQVLAELDPALFEAALQQSEANLANGEASLRLAQSKEKRNRELLAKGFISPTAMDESVQALEAAQAQVRLARAQVERDRTNLRYSVIRSPISGVVVARNVDVGQTVAASFQTPTLFQIAKDLRDMQIDSSVAEADVGSVFVGQKVRFTVDAFPDRSFKGEVRQIRLNPTIQQNVVTYNVVVGVDNEDGKLMPGMTAYVRISVADRKQVLRVPNTALRFKPESGDNSKTEGKSRRSKDASPTVYRLENGDKLVPVKLKTGITDGNTTEVLEGALKAGELLVTKDTAPKKETKKPAFQMRMF